MRRTPARDSTRIILIERISCLDHSFGFAISWKRHQAVLNVIPAIGKNRQTLRLQPTVTAVNEGQCVVAHMPNYGLQLGHILGY